MKQGSFPLTALYDMDFPFSHPAFDDLPFGSIIFRNEQYWRKKSVATYQLLAPSLARQELAEFMSLEVNVRSAWQVTQFVHPVCMLANDYWINDQGQGWRRVGRTRKHHFPAAIEGFLRTFLVNGLSLQLGIGNVGFQSFPALWASQQLFHFLNVFEPPHMGDCHGVFQFEGEKETDGILLLHDRMLVTEMQADSEPEQFEIPYQQIELVGLLQEDVDTLRWFVALDKPLANGRTVYQTPELDSERHSEVLHALVEAFTEALPHVSS